MNLIRAMISVVAVLLFIAGCALGSSEGKAISGQVVKVIDGDSLRITGVAPDIRLWGLDAPEWNEQGGAAATAALRGLSLHRYVECDHMDTDKYNRFVGRCTLEDGRDLAAEMIAAGVSAEYCWFSKGYYGTC
ncbi:MAG: hypothetical protein GXP04_12165 [Alphaproteobacteria bacterium]|nr:hypothetical protein [Alphaproteobacteria bacterium]